MDEIIKVSGKQLYYECKECKASYKSKMGLYYHTSSKHESNCYPCKYCEYKTSYKTHLKKHKESVQCDYHGTKQSHEKSIHEGAKYSCDKCDYHATKQSNLKTHKKSIHEGVKYSCGKCDYQVADRSNLKKTPEIHS